MKEQKAHAISVCEKTVYQYNIEKDRFRQMFCNAYTVLKKEASLLVFVLVDTSLKGYSKNLSSKGASSLSTGTVNEELVQEQNRLLSQVHLSLPRRVGQQKVEILGVCMVFIHPETFQYFKVSAGLVHITGKKATQTDHAL